jgi:hypothetical protein
MNHTAMAFYEYNLVVFVVFNSSLAYFQHRDGKTTVRNYGLGGRGAKDAAQVPGAVIWHFKKTFFQVYLLVGGTDWLQACWNFPT